MKHLSRSAALVAVLAGLVACGDDGGGGAAGTTTSAPTTTQAPTTTGSSTTTPSSSSPSTTAPGATSSTPPSSDDARTAAIDAVHAYVDAVAAGDLGRAWSLVDERSQQAVGGFEAFEDLRSGLSEGIGAWASAADRDFSAMPVPEARPNTWVVAVSGHVALEGPVSLHATSMPVYVRGADATVSPFEDIFRGEEIFSFAPLPGSRIAPDEAPVLTVPDALTVVPFVDGERAMTERTSSERGARALEITAGGPLAAGDHVVTVALIRDDEAVGSVSAAYRVDDR